MLAEILIRVFPHIIKLLFVNTYTYNHYTRMLKYVYSAKAAKLRRYFAVVESRTQGSRPRAPFRGQTLSRPRTKDTNASVLENKKKVFKIFFRRSPKKRSSKTIFQPIYKLLAIQKTVLSSSRGQGKF